MKLWLISQDKITGWDHYDCAVVAACTASEARAISPAVNAWESKTSWVDPADVNVEYLGEAKPGTEPGVIVSSFVAG